MKEIKLSDEVSDNAMKIKEQTKGERKNRIKEKKQKRDNK